jgi:Beta/Gamma crystallin
MARVRPVFPWLAVFIAFLWVDAVPSAQSRQIGGVGVTVFEDPDYRGRSATFRDNVPDLRKYDLNDRISSLRIARGELWEACVDIDYGGRCVVFSGTEQNLKERGGWNDEISSLRRVRGGGRSGIVPPIGGPQIVLYDRESFRGNSRPVTGPQSSLGSFGGRVQSVRILSGRWELCEGTRWSDRCVTINESVPDINRFGLGRVSSVRPR